MSAIVLSACSSGSGCEDIDVVDLHYLGDYTMSARVLRDGEPLRDRLVEFGTTGEVATGYTDDSGYAVATVPEVPSFSRESVDNAESIYARVPRKGYTCNSVFVSVDLE